MFTRPAIFLLALAAFASAAPQKRPGPRTSAPYPFRSFLLTSITAHPSRDLEVRHTGVDIQSRGLSSGVRYAGEAGKVVGSTAKAAVKVVVGKIRG